MGISGSLLAQEAGKCPVQQKCSLPFPFVHASLHSWPGALLPGVCWTSRPNLGTSHERTLPGGEVRCQGHRHKVLDSFLFHSDS